LNGTALPDWFLNLQNDRSNYIHIFTEEEDHVDYYEITVTSYLDNLFVWGQFDGIVDPAMNDGRRFDPDSPPSDLIYTSSFFLNLTVELPPVNEYQVTNTEPFLLPTPRDLTMIAGQRFVHNFGPVKDNENNEVTVTFTIDSQAIDFVTFDSNSMELLV